MATLQKQLDPERSRADQAAEAAKRNAVRLAEAEARIAKLWAVAETAALVRDALETALTAAERAGTKFETEAAAERAARAQVEAEVRLLQQAEQARRSLGRLARLQAAWRGQ